MESVSVLSSQARKAERQQYQQNLARRSRLRRAAVSTNPATNATTTGSSTSSDAVLTARTLQPSTYKNFFARSGRSLSESTTATKTQRDGKAELFALASRGKGSRLVSALSKQWCSDGRSGSWWNSKSELDVDAVTDSRGNSLLHTACRHGHAEVAQVLIQMGACVQKRSASEASFIPRSSSSPQSEPQRGSGARLESANSASQASNSAVTISHGGWTALHYAAKSGSYDTLRCVLGALEGLAEEQRLAALNEQCADGSSSLHCVLEQSPAAQLLAARDMSASDGDALAASPLTSCLRLLLSSGCDLSIATGTHRRWCCLLGLAPSFLKFRLTSGLTALHCAVDKADVRALRYLARAGCDLDARTTHAGVCDGGMTALHFACEQLQADGVRVLLGAGADPNATDRYGTAPLHLALATPGDGLVNAFGDSHVMVAADVLENLDDEERDKIAAARRDIVRMLLEAGADRHVVARQRPTSDPCIPSSPRSAPVSLDSDWSSGGTKTRLILADIAASESCLGGREVLQLLGTCFVQPFSLRTLASREAARFACARRQSREISADRYLQLLDKLATTALG